MKSYMASDIKDINRKTVFDLLKTEGELSKAQISRRTGISSPTVIKIVDFLHERHILNEAGTGPSSVGKKPTLLRFNPDAFYTVGVEYEGEVLKVGIIDLQGRVVRLNKLEVQPHFESVFRDILPKAITSLALSQGAPRVRIAGIGIGFSGVVDSVNSVIEYAPLVDVFERKSFLDIKDQLEQQFAVPVCIENDVNADSLGEFTERRLGAGNDLIYLSLGTGLGAGIIIDGKLWRGRRNSAGEIGYMVFDSAFHASKSKPGWLENRVNIQAFAEKLIGAPASLPTIEIGRLLQEAPLEKRQSIVSAIASDLALSVANLVTILDIQLVVLGGVIADILGADLHDTVKDRVDRLCPTPVRFEPSRCREPGIVGSAILAMEKGLAQILSS